MSARRPRLPTARSSVPRSSAPARRTGWRRRRPRSPPPPPLPVRRLWGPLPPTTYSGSRRRCPGMLSVCFSPTGTTRACCSPGCSRRGALAAGRSLGRLIRCWMLLLCRMIST